VPNYFKDERERRSAAELLIKDEARWIAVKIAKLPELAEAGSSGGVNFPFV
jgi:hypothetical protein